MGNKASKVSAANRKAVKQLDAFCEKNNHVQHNEFIKYLVTCYCNDKNLRKENITLPIAIISIIVSYTDIDIFSCENYDQSMFQISPLNNVRGKFMIQKIQNYEHATIIFSNQLKRNSFAFQNFNFVFRFKIINGIVRLLLMPSISDRNCLIGYINDNIASKQNLQIIKLNGNNVNSFCHYDETVRIEIDMISSSLIMTNETNHQMPAKRINISNNNNNKSYIAFSLMNPYAQLNIIEQCWVRIEKQNTNSNNEISDDDCDIDMIDYNVTVSNINHEISSNKIELPEHVIKQLKPGLNYIGVKKCDMCCEYSICNRGLSDNDIRPNEDYLFGSIRCDQCNNKFKSDILILSDCNYTINYGINPTDDIKSQSGVAYPYIDVQNDIIQNPSYHYLTISTQPMNTWQ